jgi:transposase
VGTIASSLGVHRDAVRRAIEAERFRMPAGRPRPSRLDPYVPFIRETLERYPRLRATRLWQMLGDRGCKISANQLRRVVAKLRPAPRGEAYLRLSVLPGEQAQVDWGCFGTVGAGAAKRPLSCFVMVLSWSRAIHAVFTLDQTLENFLRGHVEAFNYIRSIPRVILYDNLKSAVLERRGDAIHFHPRLLELCAHYHFAARPVSPARGNEKGRVERQIQYLRTSFFAARSFRDVDDLNAQFARALERRLSHYARPHVLCIDEIGYLSYDNHAADLLFQIVTRRYERRSIVMTTNLAFSEWTTVFPNAACATALIDRLTHHAEIITIEAESYRRREAEETTKERRRGQK